jgi:chromosome segregation ATPase
MYTVLFGKGFNIMLKKLFIATVAVIAGMVVLTKVTKISPMVWFNDCCRSINRAVPPEVQLKQLNNEIGNIDKDIKKNIGRVAAMEEEVNRIEKEAAAERTHLNDLRAEIGSKRTRLEDRFVKADGSDLTRQLDRCVTEYTCLKEKNKIKEKVLQEKKKALETAHNRLTQMGNEKEKLTLLSARLAGHLEAVRMQQTGTPVEFDDSAIARCHELAKDIETRLNTAEREAQLLKKYGYGDSSAVAEEGKSRDEVLKAARKALAEDNDTVDNVAVEKK